MRRRSTSGQSGFTLVELLVIVFIMGLIGAICLATFNTGSNALGRVDDDIRGQQDLRIVTERLTRDIRAGRGVHDDTDPATADSDQSKLILWIDYDADYIKDAATEIIVWDVVASSGGHYDVRRKQGSDPAQTVGRSVIDALAFQYFRDDTGTLQVLDASVAATDLTLSSVVEVSMDYDAIVGAYLEQKTNTYRIRLRNTE